MKVHTAVSVLLWASASAFAPSKSVPRSSCNSRLCQGTDLSKFSPSYGSTWAVTTATTLCRQVTSSSSSSSSSSSTLAAANTNRDVDPNQISPFASSTLMLQMVKSMAAAVGTTEVNPVATTEPERAPAPTSPTSYSPFGKKWAPVQSKSVAPVAPAASTTVAKPAAPSTPVPVPESVSSYSVPKPASYSPFGKKWAPTNKSVAPTATATGATPTPVADPVQMSSFESSGVISTVMSSTSTSNLMSNNPVLGATAQPMSYSAAAPKPKPANYSPFGKKWAPKTSVSSSQIAPATSAVAGNSVTTSPATALYNAPLAATATATAAAVTATKPATYSPFGKKWGPASITVIPATAVNVVTPVTTAWAATAPYLVAPVAAPKPRSKRTTTYSPYGKKWGPASSNTVTRTATVPVTADTPAAASYMTSVATAASFGYRYSTPPVAAAATASKYKSTKPVNYSPFGKKWTLASSAAPVLLASASASDASSSSETVPSQNNYLIFGKKWKAFVRLYWNRSC